MKRYILLAEICFDWSRGEYGNCYVDNIYLGHGDFETIEKANEEAISLLKKYCEEQGHNNPLDYESTIHVKVL